MPHTSDRRYGCRLSDEWTFRGMRMAVLENDHLRVVIALDRGAEIVEFRSKSDDMDPLLHLPGGPRDPRATTPSIGSAGGAFLDSYTGGWQEILPNGGPTATHRGAEYGQHGEVALVPWTSFPTLGLPEGVRRGTQLVLAAGASVDTSLVAVSFAPAGDVTGVGTDGSVALGLPHPETDPVPHQSDRRIP